MFEAVNGFEPDGYADRYVMGRLLSPSAIPISGFENLKTLSFGDKGAMVKYAQRLLKSMVLKHILILMLLLRKLMSFI